MSYMGDDQGFLDPINITPEQTWGLDYNSPFESGGWSANDWNNFIKNIGGTFAATYNAVNHPGSYSSPPSSYAAPPADTASPTPVASSFSFDQLLQPPYVYGTIVVIGLIVFLIARRK